MEVYKAGERIPENCKSDNCDPNTDSSVDIDFIYVVAGQIDYVLKNVESMGDHGKKKKNSFAALIAASKSEDSDSTDDHDCKYEHYKMKVDEFLDQSDLRRFEEKVVRGTLGADLLGAFSTLKSLRTQK